MDRRVDVAVVGAGPAGCAAAIVAARAGRSVLMVDKARFPRDKCCGDGLTTLALRQLEALGLEPASVPSWTEIPDAVVHSPSGRTVRLPLPRHRGLYAVVARRTDLDAALVDLARRAGAEVAEGATLLTAGQDARGVRLVVEDVGSVQAGHVVGADGMWSGLRKALGIGGPGYRGDWHAFRQYVRGVPPEARGSLHVLFEEDLLPGYAWSFPVGSDGANIGFGVLRGGRVAVGDMGARWRDLLGRPRLRALLGDAVPEGPPRAWPIPADLGAVPLTAGRVLFVGDAAAATDPLTGEGIGQAVLTGVLAAEAIVGQAASAARADGAGDEAGARYEAAVRVALRADHRLAVALSALMARPWAARGAIRVTGSTAWTRRQFARWMFEDYPRALLVTPGRWRRGVIGGDGAYRDRAGRAPLAA